MLTLAVALLVDERLEIGEPVVGGHRAGVVGLARLRGEEVGVDVARDKAGAALAVVVLAQPIVDVVAAGAVVAVRDQIGVECEEVAAGEAVDEAELVVGALLLLLLDDLVALLGQLALLPGQERLERHLGHLDAQAGALLLDEHLDADLLLLALLLHLALEREARRQRVPIHARVAVGTRPEPAVRGVLHRFDEEFAYLVFISRTHSN